MNKARVKILVEYIFALSLALLTYFFYSMVIDIEEKYFTIPLLARIDSKFTFTQPLIKSVTVLLRGSNTALARIGENNMSAYVDFSFYDSEGVYNEEVQIIRNGIFQNAGNIEIVVSPSSIESIVEKKISKNIKIFPLFLNTPSPDYGFQGYVVTPSKVKVTGPRSTILGLESLSTQEINLANEITDFSTTARIINNTNTVIHIDPEEVEVIAKIERLIIVRTIDEVSIEIVNLKEDLLLQTQLPNAILIVRGNKDSVSSYVPAISLDAEIIDEAGTYTLVPSIAQERNIEIISFFPTEIMIEVEAKNIDPIETPPVTNIDFLKRPVISDVPPSPSVENKNESAPINLSDTNVIPTEKDTPPSPSDTDIP